MQCLYQMVQIFAKKQSEVGESEQGFLTSWNRFVDREEAAKIAFKTGQIEEEVKSLFSEHLY